MKFEKKVFFLSDHKKKVLQLAKYRKVTAMHRTSESSFVESVLHKCVVKVYVAQLATPVQEWSFHVFEQVNGQI